MTSRRVHGAGAKKVGYVLGRGISVSDKQPELNMHAILDQITEGFFALDAEWRFTYINALACTFLRRERSSLIGESVWSEFAEAIGLQFELQYRKAMEEQTLVQFEEYFEPLAQWFQVRAYPSANELYVYFQDITSRKTMEQQIQRSNHIVSHAQSIAEIGVWERYQSLKHYNPDGICSLDFAGGLLGVNPALEKLLGYTQHQLLNMSVFDLLFPQDVEGITNFLFAAFRGAEPAKMGCRLRCADGHPIDVYCTRVPIVIHGEIRGLYMIIQDITERKKTETRLVEAEARYRLISENAHDIISYSTQSGIMEYVSPASHKLLGYTPEEIIGNPGNFAYHPDDVLHIQSTAERVLRGEAVDRFECRVRHKNGSYLWLETTIRPIRDDMGGIVHVLGIGRDITERKQAEKQLKDSEERYRTLVESSLNVIAVNDGTKWLYINNAGLKMFGASSIDDIVGRPLHDFLHPDDHAACEERTRMILNERKRAPLAEQKWYALNGDIIESEVLAVPMVFDNQVSVQLIIDDISDRKQAEALLIQSEKLSAIGQLAAGVAHEIRNPLTAIKGFLQLLHAKDDGANSEYFYILKQEVSRIEMISSEMLMLAKPQAMSFEERHVQPMLHSVVTLLESQALMKNVEIVTEYEDVHSILCVEHAIKQVFVNLLKNSIESMSNRGQIIVRLKQTNDDVLVQIEDQGCGIPEELLTRMGQPFFTTKLNGTGLGLMVTKKIVENHNGAIDFTSQVGVGTIVSVWIPRSGA